MKIGKMTFVVMIALILGMAGLLVYILKPDILSSVSTSSTASPVSNSKASDFAAVFLVNNQVYFGKISNLETDYPVIRDVYYLRVQKSLVPSEDTSVTGVKVEDKKKPTPQTKDELTLVKLGNEIHGPKDEIKINKDQILYVEELKEDSKVVKAIKQYESKNK